MSGSTARLVVVLAVGGMVTMTGCGSTAAPSAPGAAGSRPVASPTARSGAAAGQPAGCRSAQLAITMVSTGAAGGQAGGYLRFTNQAATPCKLTGWPRVSALTGSGRAVAAAHARSTTFGAWQYTPPLPVLRLAPGSSAYAVIESDNLPAGRATSCPPPYRSLRVAPPGGSQAVTISAWLPGANSYLPACRSIRGTATIAVSAVVLLATLPH